MNENSTHILMRKLDSNHFKIEIGGNLTYEELTWFIGQLADKTALSWSKTSGLNYADSLQAVLLTVRANQLQEHNNSKGADK